MITTAIDLADELTLHGFRIQEIHEARKHQQRAGHNARIVLASTHQKPIDIDIDYDPLNGKLLIGVQLINGKPVYHKYPAQNTPCVEYFTHIDDLITFLRQRFQP